MQLQYYDELSTYLQKFTDKQIGVSDNLFDIGLLNSLFIMQIIGFIEFQFHIKMENDDITRDNFKTIHQINCLILKKKKTDK